ncbi:SusC/RagA family TonB-linked outer membrane protein [Negadavirga shengliensis]|uniref:SusC/RagA family TonB-linked outer membrane protein n=1 Tax=Negadavirga shengliensis TaxID=1389218 RepID=A0ABV9SWX0_9BACT
MKKTILKHVLHMTKLFSIAFLFQCATMSLLLAWNGNAQVKNIEEVEVSLSLEDVTIDRAFRELEKLTGYNFVFTNKELRDVARVSIISQEESLYQVLLDLARQADLSFKQVDFNIHVKKALTNNLAVQISQSEDFPITGKVMDEKGEPIPGVTVVLEGTSIGTVTDIDGGFSLEVSEEGVLVISFIGYQTQKVNIGSRNVINIVLLEDMASLEEVVVIGYGEIKKSDLTGAVGSVDNDRIVRMAPILPAQAIQGQVSGVNVQKVNGKPGDDFNIDIRGLSSIGGNNAPLVVIDGVMGGSLNALNPADIEQIDILKDASATAIYGSRGSNGVVIVTTKQGKSGRNVISYDGYAGIKSPVNLPNMMGGPRFVEYFDESVKNGSGRFLDEKEQQNVANGTYTDWIELLLKNGLQTNHNISLSGGNENTRHFFSAGYLSEEGNVPEEKFERFNLKANIDANINNWIKAGVSTYFSYSLQDQGSNEALRSAYRLRPTGDAYDENGELLFWPTTSDSQTPNALFDPPNVKNEFRNFRLFGNIYLELMPLEGLSFKTVFAPYLESIRNGTFTGRYSKANTGNRNGRADYRSQLNMSYTLDNILSYNKTTGNHSFNGILANSVVVNRNEGAEQNVMELPFDSFWYNTGSASNIVGISSYLQEWALLSYMGRFNYTYHDKYQLTFTGRWDGSSKLAEGHEWAFFPSAAVAWRLGDEAFLQDLNVISNLKLRLSYGLVGNDAVSPYSTQASIRSTVYDWAGQPAVGFAPAAIANRALTWEKSKEINFGVDFGLFDNRLGGSFELYKRTTDDLILNRVLPPHTGFESVVGNIGSTLNRGIELSLNTVNIQSNKFSWRTDLTFARNHNEILELYGDDQDDLGNLWFIGQPIRVWYDYVFDGIWQLDESEVADSYGFLPGNVKVKDLNNDGSITADGDRTILGSPLPKWLGGMTNTFIFNNLDFSFMLYTQQGAMVRSRFHTDNFGREWNGRYNKLDVDFWTETNPSNSWPAPNRTGGRVFEELKAYTDVSFVRVQNVTLGYSFPNRIKERMKMSNLRVYATANNPIVFTKYEGFDPEWAEQNTFNMGISSAVYLLGVNVSF